MKVFRLLGMPRLATSARRLHCPIQKDALVLEVGSGDRPYPRSDVLLDASLFDYERGGRLIIDRPLVIGIGEQLPFGDHAFDFSIASHVLEHSSNPTKFLKDLQRVSLAGYIEIPDAILEVLEPNPAHRLLVTTNESGLKIIKKKAWDVNPFISAGWSRLKKESFAMEKFMKKNEGEMLVRFYWTNQIPFEIVNDEVNASWKVPHPPSLEHRSPDINRFRELLIDIIYKYAHHRRRKLEIPSFVNLLQCCDCQNNHLSLIDSYLFCENCGREYLI